MLVSLSLLPNSPHSTFLEIQLANLTEVYPSVSLYIFKSRYTLQTVHQIIWTLNTVYSKVNINNTLEHTLFHKVYSGVLFAKYTSMFFHRKYTWMNIRKVSKFRLFSSSEFPRGQLALLGKHSFQF